MRKTAFEYLSISIDQYQIERCLFQLDLEDALAHKTHFITLLLKQICTAFLQYLHLAIVFNHSEIFFKMNIAFVSKQTNNQLTLLFCYCRRRSSLILSEDVCSVKHQRSTFLLLNNSLLNF